MKKNYSNQNKAVNKANTNQLCTQQKSEGENRVGFYPPELSFNSDPIQQKNDENISEKQQDFPEGGREERIKKEIAKLKEEYPDKSLIELQNLVAAKFQKKKWYRGGKTKSNGAAKRKSSTTGQNIETMMVWKVYDRAPELAFDSESNRTSLPINAWHDINLDSFDKFVPGTVSGEIEFYFDDKGEPDRLTIEGNGIPPVVFEYGDRFNDADNIRTQRINVADLKNFLLRVQIEHPTDINLPNTDYTLKIKALNVVGELKTPKLDYFINKHESLDGDF